MKKNKFRISIIGAGRVGTALSYSLFKKGFKFLSVIDKDIKRAKNLKNTIQALNFSDKIKDLNSKTNLLFLTTSDDQLPVVVNQLAKTKKLHFNDLIAVHTSGTHTIDSLSILKSKGAKVISLHPIQTFPSGKKISEMSKFVENIYFGVETDRKNLKIVRSLLNSINSKMILINNENKPLYHIACVFASNYIIANLNVIELLSEKIGIGNTWKKAFKRLIYTSVDNSLKSSPTNALTGPIERSDFKTIAKHIEIIKQCFPEIMKIYCISGIQAAKMALKKKSITKRQFNKILNLLRENL